MCKSKIVTCVLVCSVQCRIGASVASTGITASATAWRGNSTRLKEGTSGIVAGTVLASEAASPSADASAAAGAQSL